MRIRLLPKDGQHGWIPYAWLIYLVIYFIVPFSQDFSWVSWTATLLGGFVFLALYFRGYWVDGRPLLAIVAAITLLGVLFSPTNWGATTFFIYAAAFLGRASRPRHAFRYLVLIEFILLAEIAFTTLSWPFAVPSLVFVIIIGGVNIHYAEIERKNLNLKRSQEEVQHLAMIAERERIARDLHDLLGHTLSMITLKSELAGKLIHHDPLAAEREISEVESVSREALQEVRRAVQGYKARSLKEELSKAREVLATAGVRATIQSVDLPLEPAQESALTLALRESITNIVRHADATLCTIQLHRQGEEVILEVSDDGKGGSSPEGSGLQGMRERVEALKGTISRDGSEGMRLRIHLPLGPHILENLT